MPLPNGKPIVREIVDNLINKFYPGEIILVCHERHQTAFAHEFRDLPINITPLKEPAGTLTDTRAVCKSNSKLYADEDYLIHYCDMQIDLDYGKFLSGWLNRNDTTNGMLVLTQVRSEYSSAYWSGVTGREIVYRFVEKPLIEAPIWTGIGIFNRGVIEKSMIQQTDFGKHLLPELATKQELEAYIHEGDWVDLGSLNNYRKILNKQFFL